MADLLVDDSADKSVELLVAVKVVHSDVNLAAK
jgi:hypothetical protein